VYPAGHVAVTGAAWAPNVTNDVSATAARETHWDDPGIRWLLFD
jgi:hypothetical protein